MFFFFKQKTAYEMRISDWSSDVCSSDLSARIVPAEGGATEFATMRAAWDDLPEATRRRLEGLIAEHSLVWSRSLVDPAVTGMKEAQKAEVQPARQVMIRTKPVQGSKGPMNGTHQIALTGGQDQEGLKTGTSPRGEEG